MIDLSKDEKIEEIMRAETCEELQKIVGEDLLQSPQLRFPSSAKVLPQGPVQGL